MAIRTVASIVLMLVTSVIADAQFNMIHGYIIVPTDKHSDGFEVLLTARDSEIVISHTQVSSSGEYLFSNLQDGYDDLLVRLDGFRESRTPVQIGNPLRIGGSINPFYSVNIVLIPDPESRHVTAEKAAYSQALLDEYSMGLSDIGMGKYELAVTHLEKVSTEVPEFYDAHFNLGVVYESLARNSEAEREFRTAHELNSESARPLLALGRLFVVEADSESLANSKPENVQRKLEEAREVLMQALMLEPKLATGFYYLGLVDFFSAKYLNAEKSLKFALDLDPELFAARMALINVFIRQKLWQRALDNVDAFLIENPLSPHSQEVAGVREQVVRRLQFNQ